MTDFLEHLSKDTLPDQLLQDFVSWCVWEQGRPALVKILTATGLHDFVAAIEQSDDLLTFAQSCEAAGQHASEARKSTGPFGLSTAEAASFIASKMARSAMPDTFDAEEVSFFAAQMCGWRGFAEAGFADARGKLQEEENAKLAQENKLRALWETHKP